MFVIFSVVFLPQLVALATAATLAPFVCKVSS